MKPPVLTEAHLATAGIGAFFRPRDVEPLGVSFRDLQRLVEAGHVDKMGRGLYRLAVAEPTDHPS